MNFSTDLTTARTRLLLSLAAVAGALALVALTVADSADARATGGVGYGSSAASTSPSDDSQGTTSRARYERLWDRVSLGDKRWARQTAKCESGGDPDAIGGGGLYRGAFQFMKSTWKASPKSPGGDPIAFPYKTQAVVAVALKNRDGAQHWPVCG